MKKYIVPIVVGCLVIAIAVLAFAYYVWPMPQLAQRIEDERSAQIDGIANGFRTQIADSAMVANAAPKATGTLEPAATPAPALVNDQVVVITATGMADIGQLLATQKITPQVSGEISWDELKKIDGWTEMPCLTPDVKCLYVQSGKPNSIKLPLLPGQAKFVVPAGSTLVWGTYSGNLSLEGKSYQKSAGFMGALTENTSIESLEITDGFILLILRDYGQGEYCLRIAQAMNQKWAPFEKGPDLTKDHIYRPSTWSEPVCSGVITTVIDPND